MRNFVKERRIIILILIILLREHGLKLNDIFIFEYVFESFVSSFDTYIYKIISKTADVILRTHVGSSFARF